MGFSFDAGCNAPAQQALPPRPHLTTSMLELPAIDDEAELIWGPSLPGTVQHMESPVLAQKAKVFGTSFSLRAATIVTYRRPRDVPSTLLFHALACGSPKVWHEEGRSEFWNRRFLKLYRCPFSVVPIGELPRLACLWQFLALRFWDGTPLQASLGSPIAHAEGCFCAQWLQLSSIR